MKTRLLAGAGAAALLAACAAILPGTNAYAAGCGSFTPCGEVSNYSSWEMRDTTTLGAGPHYCDVWNRYGGRTPNWWHAKCTQETLRTGVHRGGGNVDVDAFTFASNDYMLNFHGSWSWKTKGVWTKIQSIEGAYCYTNWTFYVPYCEVIYE
jgi:hypothetical protein